MEQAIHVLDLARLLAVREAQTVEDATPWVLDHSDDEWVSSPGVGASAFNRRARQAGLLTAAEEVTLARRIEAGAFAQERLGSGVELRRTERRGLDERLDERLAVEELTIAVRRVRIGGVGLLGIRERVGDGEACVPGLLGRLGEWCVEAGICHRLGEGEPHVSPLWIGV